MRCTHLATLGKVCASGSKPKFNGRAASLDAARKSSWTNGNTPMSAAEILSPTSQCEPAKRSSIILRLVAKRLRGLLDLFDFLQSFAKENRANDFVTGTHDIGFTFSERAPNQTRFLGRFAEERRIGIFAIEITHDGERLVEDEIAIFESGS